MKFLFKAEVKKAFAMKSFWICLLITLMISLSFAIMDKWSFEFLASENIAHDEEGVDEDEVEYTAIDAITNSNTDAISMYFSIFAIIFYTSEFTYGTYKNIISRGYKKMQLYLSKCNFCFLGILLFYVLNVILYAGLTAVMGGTPSSLDIFDIKETIIIVLAQMIVLVSFTSMIILLSNIIRNTAITIIAYLVLFRILPTTLNSFHLISNNTILSNLSKIQLGNILTSITTNSYNSNNIIFAIGISMIYIVLTLSIGLLIFNKRDIQ